MKSMYYTISLKIKISCINITRVSRRIILNLKYRLFYDIRLLKVYDKTKKD